MHSGSVLEARAHPALAQKSTNQSRLDELQHPDQNAEKYPAASPGNILPVLGDAELQVYPDLLMHLRVAEEFSPAAEGGRGTLCASGVGMTRSLSGNRAQQAQDVATSFFSAKVPEVVPLTHSILDLDQPESRNLT